MSQIQPHEKIELHVGQTLPIITATAYEDDLVTAVPLTNYYGVASFAYPGQAPHATRPMVISDAAAGECQIRLDGSETPSVGELLIGIRLVDQGTEAKTGSTAEQWTASSGPPIRATVVP